MRMYQVDAFTDRLFAGNPAAVLVLDDWFADGLMLAIAQENNLPETAFARMRPDGDWDLRWFSTVQEVDFCGHGTLATAHIIYTKHRAEADLVFHTRAGVLKISKVSNGYRLDVPKLAPEFQESIPLEISDIFSVQPAAIFRNFENIFVDLGNADAVRTFEPDMQRIGRLGSVGLVITGADTTKGGADFVSRSFAPGIGIPEDPVTGSTHATLVPYWAGKLGRNKLMAYQASARGGWIECEVDGERVFLSGNAVTFMEATISLPV